MTPKAIFEKMYAHDAYSQWLGIKCVKIDYGLCVLEMTVRDEMTNGFGIAHGAITYALADSAFAFASNSQGQFAVSIETSISHVSPCKPGDVITAHASEITIGKTLGRYQVHIKRKEKVVAIFNGTVFRKTEKWSEDD